MVTYKFQHRLRDQGRAAKKSCQDVDSYLDLPKGTCAGWQDGSISKPDESTIARIARLFDCAPSSLDPAMDLKMNEPLQHFAKKFEIWLSEGIVDPAQASGILKQAVKGKSFRGAGDDAFWDELIEKTQKPPKLDL